MMPSRALRRIARERGLALDLVEKDYLIGWMLFCISKTSLAKSLAFKGGTALSKVYFPSGWRMSEDLDFTLLGNEDTSDVAAKLFEEIPRISEKWVPEAALRFRDRPHSNPDYVQARLQYTGPVSPNNVKMDITVEKYVGVTRTVEVPRPYEDWPRFKVTVYSLETILAEKMRALLERRRVRDWYDVWRLLTRIKNRSKVRQLFLRKLEGKDMEFSGVEDFYPEGLLEELKTYWDMGLARLTPEELPPIAQVLSEVRDRLSLLLSDASPTTRP